MRIGALEAGGTKMVMAVVNEQGADGLGTVQRSGFPVFFQNGADFVDGVFRFRRIIFHEGVKGVVACQLFPEETVKNQCSVQPGVVGAYVGQPFDHGLRTAAECQIPSLRKAVR